MVHPYPHAHVYDYSRSIVALIIVTLLVLYFAREEKDSPTTPKAFTPCSIIHFGVGLFLGAATNISESVYILLIVVFEVAENSKPGIDFSNLLGSLRSNNSYKNRSETHQGIDFWGGKYYGDSALNSSMDILLGIIGFLIGRSDRNKLRNISPASS